MARVTSHTLLANIAHVLGIPQAGSRKSEIAQRTSTALIKWCASGFPQFLEGSEYRLLTQLRGVVLEWLFPSTLVTCRGDAEVWRF